MKLINQSKLDLACGQNKTENYFGIDLVAGSKVDAVMDLEQFPWSIESESVENIVCNHYVEHTSDLIKFMNEVYRILKPKGEIKIVAPYYTSIRCWQDPTHKRAINESTFLYFNKQWREINNLSHYPIDGDFDYSYAYELNESWVNQSEEIRNFAIKHYNNVINHIHIIMTKRIKI